jgi:hypothetical protein
MDFIELKDLNLHDTVQRDSIIGTLIWKSQLELPAGFIHGIPVLYIYSDRDNSYPRIEPRPTSYYYLLQFVKETREYELMMKGAIYEEVVKKGRELQDAYRIQHFEETPSGFWRLRE